MASPGESVAPVSMVVAPLMLPEPPSVAPLRTVTVPLPVPLPVALLRGADEVFLSSSGGGVLPIGKVDGQALPAFPGPVTRRLQEGYWALHEEPAYRDPVTYT